MLYEYGSELFCRAHAIRDFVRSKLFGHEESQLRRRALSDAMLPPLFSPRRSTCSPRPRTSYSKAELDASLRREEMSLRERAALGPRPLTASLEASPRHEAGTRTSSTIEELYAMRARRKVAQPLRERTLVEDKHIPGKSTFGFPYGIWGVPPARPSGLVVPKEPSPRTKQVHSMVAAAPPTAAPPLSDGLVRLTSASSLYEALRPPHKDGLPRTRLLRGSWVLARAEEMRHVHALGQRTDAERAYRKSKMAHLALPRRQDLPEEAFIGTTELHELAPHGFVFEARAAILAVSYVWQDAEHADPEGRVLLLIADAILGLQDKRARGVWGHDQFPYELGLFCARASCLPRLRSTKRPAVLLSSHPNARVRPGDWGSLMQRDPETKQRTPLEESLYEASIADLSLWYAHALTTVLIVSASSHRYFDRGWPLLESSLARLLKPYRPDVWIPVRHPHAFSIFYPCLSCAWHLARARAFTRCRLSRTPHASPSCPRSRALPRSPRSWFAPSRTGHRRRGPES